MEQHTASDHSEETTHLLEHACAKRLGELAAAGKLDLDWKSAGTAAENLLAPVTSKEVVESDLVRRVLERYRQTSQSTDQ